MYIEVNIAWESLISHNGSNYDYYCIIKELAEEFEEQFTFLRENTEK